MKAIIEISDPDGLMKALSWAGHALQHLIDCDMAGEVEEPEPDELAALLRRSLGVLESLYVQVKEEPA